MANEFAIGQPVSGPMGEMNTTPLIDVMLVLLIMFIITFPVQSHAVKLDFPQGPAPMTLDPSRNLVTLDRAGQVRWNGSAVGDRELRDMFARSAALRAEPETQFKPAQDARYERVDQVLAVMRSSRITRLGFVGNERYADAF